MFGMSATIIQSVKVQYDPTPLREAMKRLGVSQRELAREKGVHYGTINYALSVNADRRVSPDLIRWLCSRLGVAEGAVYRGLAP